MVTVLLLGSMACYGTVVRGGPMSQSREESDTTFNFLWGISTGHANTNCPNGIAEVEVYTPFWDYLLEPLTAGLVAAHQVNYVCAAPPQMYQPPTYYQQPYPPAPQNQQPLYPQQSMPPPQKPNGPIPQQQPDPPPAG